MKMRTHVVVMAVAGFLASASPAAADDKGPNRLDLSVPDVPAFTALGVSPSKVSRPSNPKDLVAALSSGISADGHVQAGIAIEVSPTKIFDNALNTEHLKLFHDILGGLRFSLASNAVAAGIDTKNQLALGARWSLFTYHPETDFALNACITTFIAEPDMPETLGTDGTPAPSAASTAAAANNAENKRLRDACRTAARSAHLAQTGIELAYVYSEQAINDNTLSSFAALADSAWLSATLGYNSFTLNPAARHDRTGWKNAVAAAGGAWGLEPTLFVRWDTTKLTDDGRQADLFVAGRLPLRADGWSVFVEGGFKKANLTNHPSPPAASKDGVPFGIGGDLRLSDGTWFGLFAGADLKTGTLLSLGSIKWSLGEKRPY